MNRVPVFLYNGKVYTFKMCGEYIQKVHNKWVVSCNILWYHIHNEHKIYLIDCVYREEAARARNVRIIYLCSLIRREMEVEEWQLRKEQFHFPGQNNRKRHL